MELPSDFLGRTVLNAWAGNDEHMLIVTNESTQEENLSQTLQTNYTILKKISPF